MATDFDPNSCPVGISNGKDINRLGDRIDMAIERLTEKVAEVKEDITALSSNMDKKFDNVDKKLESVDKRFDSMNKKIDDLQKSVPSVVDDEIKRRKGDSAYRIIAWVFTGVLGSAVISIAVTLLRKWLNLPI